MFTATFLLGGRNPCQIRYTEMLSVREVSQGQVGAAPFTQLSFPMRMFIRKGNYRLSKLSKMILRDCSAQRCQDPAPKSTQQLVVSSIPTVVIFFQHFSAKVLRQPFGTPRRRLPAIGRWKAGRRHWPVDFRRWAKSLMFINTSRPSGRRLHNYGK